MRILTVICTEKILLEMHDLCNEQTKTKRSAIQREILCKPLTTVFPDNSLEVIQYELLRNGLFAPEEWMDLDSVVKALKMKNVWRIIRQEYERLKSLWNGPSISIYIYPLTKKRPILDGIVPNKNGVAYKNAVFLFVSIELDERELRALLAHEYHHICRLHYLNVDLATITLKDSLILEGMAEYAVEELYGEQLLSPWTKRYSLTESLKIWEEKFLNALSIKGLNQHGMYLYGDEGEGLPNWIGYCIGYHIVHTFQHNQGALNQVDLYTTPMDVILAHSDFSIKE